MCAWVCVLRARMVWKNHYKLALHVFNAKLKGKEKNVPLSFSSFLTSNEKHCLLLASLLFFHLQSRLRKTIVIVKRENGNQSMYLCL